SPRVVLSRLRAGDGPGVSHALPAALSRSRSAGAESCSPLDIPDCARGNRPPGRGPDRDVVANGFGANRSETSRVELSSETGRYVVPPTTKRAWFRAQKPSAPFGGRSSLSGRLRQHWS